MLPSFKINIKMQELIDKYRGRHKDTDRSWKLAVIEKCKKEGVMYIDPYQDIDWLYDDCLDHLFENTTRRITNLAKKLGHKQPPCHHCRKIIKFWDYSD